MSDRNSTSTNSGFVALLPNPSHGERGSGFKNQRAAELNQMSVNLKMFRSDSPLPLPVEMAREVSKPQVCSEAKDESVTSERDLV